MEQWLDDLSEDWVPQPQSQPSSSSLPSSPRTNSEESQSRIPKPKFGSVSKSSRSVNRAPESPKNVLKARTPSQLNASHNRLSRDRLEGKGAPREREGDSLHNTSTRNVAGSIQGTVQYRASATKSSNAKATPEWKRRLAGGNASDGLGSDLLSPKPVGLQGVFKPPTLKGEQAKKGVVKRRPPVGETKGTTKTRPISTSKSQEESPLPAIDRPATKETSQVVDNRKPSAELARERNISQPDGLESSLASELSNSDDFSPAIVSKQTTVDGRISYIAMESPRKKASSNFTQIFRGESPKPGSTERTEKELLERIKASEEQNADANFTSQSLPEDLSIGTDAFAANGGFVSLKRGGYSEEGSSMQRPLSVSDASPFHSEHVDHMPVFQHVVDNISRSQSRSQTPPLSPRTPERQRPVAQSSPERPRSSGSPLKLFDKYDTFTNERLLRRMSKFEETLPPGEAATYESDEQRPSSPSPGPKSLQRPSRPYAQGIGDGSRVSSFGDGELDAYAFPDPPVPEPKLPQLPRVSYKRPDLTSTRATQASKRSLDRSFAAQGTLSETPTRPDLAIVNGEGEGEPDDDRLAHPQHDHSQAKTHFSINGKRLHDSPIKDLAAKRPRTTHHNHGQNSVSFAQLLEHSDTPSKAVVGRKRKDALYANEQQDADPSILALRQMRRPRNPTPNHASSAQESPGMTYEDTLADRHVVESPDETQVDPPTYFLADVMAAVALDTAQKLTSESRKPSVTTADFFNEAQHIMGLIRAEKRPRSRHGNLESSVFGQQTIREESFLAESTRDDFSRPPSREGSYPSRPHGVPMFNNRAVSQLRKFEDRDELGLALSSSVRDLQSQHSRSGSESSVIHNSNHESDPPNVRILERKQGLAASREQQDAAHQGGRDGHKRTSSDKSDQSTKRSVPTGSSGSSTNRFVIAPDKVAHLLTDRMAGMVFDHKRRVWERAKEPQQQEDAVEDDQSDETERDLFQDIPDLSVDEMKELEMVRDAVSAHEVPHTERIDAQDQMPPLQEPLLGMGVDQTRPRTAEGKSITAVEDSSAPSKYSHFASSGRAPSTRATSWGDDYWPLKSQPVQAPTLPAVAEHTDLAGEEGIEHEFSILEGRAARTTDRIRNRKRQPRAVTVTFSSPPVDRVHSPDIRDAWTKHDDGSEDDLTYPSPANVHDNGKSSSIRRKNQRHSMSRPATKKSTRSMPPLDENQERSLVQYSVRGDRTLDIAISTPLPLARNFLLTSDSKDRSSPGFQLSPLAEFTVHQADKPLDASEGAIARRSLSGQAHEASNKLSLTAQELIRHLTDLEPYEPYWEYIRSIDLKDRDIQSLHMLEEFCGQVERLDISGNNISELQGIPASVRFMSAYNNCLSDLSAWHSLRNLQYLDLSGNELTTLRGLWDLVHLRGLNVDHNALENLAGLEGLDGLLSLSARGNHLSQVDFEDYDLWVNVSCD